MDESFEKIAEAPAVALETDINVTKRIGEDAAAVVQIMVQYRKQRNYYYHGRLLLFLQQYERFSALCFRYLLHMKGMKDISNSLCLYSYRMLLLHLLFI